MLAPLIDYRDYLLDELQLQSVAISRGKRVFIARKAHEVRRYDEEQIFAKAAIRGFTKVYLEELSFEESVLLFREAELIVGPHGAGWANLLFSHPATKAMLWTWAGEEEDNWYENVAFASGVSYLQIFVAVDGEGVKDRRVADYWLDPALFAQALDRLVSAPHGDSPLNPRGLPQTRGRESG
jgi:hypothetical protein